jgi:hypothetical protein
MAVSFLELTSQRPLFEICDDVIACVLLCYTHSLFVAANPVLCYFLSMLCGVCCRVLTSSILIGMYTIMSSLKSYEIVFSTYFWYSRTSGKFKHAGLKCAICQSVCVAIVKEMCVLYH